MKYMKRSKIYQCSNYNCKFSPETKEAFSYHWWRFVAEVDGLVIFNNFRYSNSTSKHQSKVRSLMSDLGIKIDLEMPLPRGIRDDQTLSEMIVESEEYLCEELLEQELKREARNERARVRRAEKRAKADAQLKANLDSLTIDDIRAHRAGLILVSAVQGE